MDVLKNWENLLNRYEKSFFTAFNLIFFQLRLLEAKFEKAMEAKSKKSPSRFFVKTKPFFPSYLLYLEFPFNRVIIQSLLSPLLIIVLPRGQTVKFFFENYEFLKVKPISFFRNRLVEKFGRKMKFSAVVQEN